MVFNPQRPYVLLDDQQSGVTRFFTDPVDIIQANGPDDLDTAFQSIDEYQKAGYYLAGFLSYELGYLLEPSLRSFWKDQAVPLLKLGVFKTPPSQAPAECLYTSTSIDLNLAPSWSLETYTFQFEKFQKYLRAGDVYQINLTFPMKGKTKAQAHDIYATYRRTQPGRYGAIVSLCETQIVSFSPELFFEKTGDTLRMRPMKGTRPRSENARSDQALLQQMRGEPKSQAENLMIVDLLRNDLSRLCKPGSVTVPELFSLETYPTLHQMTSQVEGHLREGQSWRDILTGLFPCGSVTGAPKIRAMEIIHELETGAREVYCGSIGYIAPNGDASFNVTIRTLQKSGNSIRYDVGSGVVLDSEAEDEYQECLLKARILSAPKFGFFETFRWEPDTGYCRVEAHKNRFLKAAKAFNVNLQTSDIDLLLNTQIFEDPQSPHRIRLSYEKRVGLTLSAHPLIDLPVPLKIALSKYPLTPRRQITAHKVEARNFYDGERHRLTSLLGADETVFLDHEGNLCEGSFTSLFIKEDGKLITPPLPGPLPGVLRAKLIADGKASEETISLARFLSAKHIYLGNSLRGLMRAELIDSKRH